ncbi:MAG: amidohydrolase family protein [Actinomycetota bacterium]|nr:amidohydrolase family protein [Actinomycetota bacterium]
MPDPPIPIDPLHGAKAALAGRVVTMDAARRVLDDAVAYLEGGLIVDVRERSDPAPAGFEAVAVIETAGTIYPGLIELHNHLAYDALRLWAVPRRFTNRGTWGRLPEYGQLITGPMRVLGTAPGLLPAVVRYVEAKALAGGVTTSQGIELFSNAGGRRFYRGLVRNVEATDDPSLPEALTRIADVEAKSAARFLARLNQGKRLLLHLAEGTDETARRHFLALEVARGRWAINENLIGIHCAALTRADFEVMAAHGASMVWSPLSNLLLYGQTAAVAEAKAAGVRIGLGSDWSPTGSKNLLGELKVAALASAAAGGVFSETELVAMATCGGAQILGWEAAVGSLEANKRADLMVIDGRRGDPYRELLSANEADVRLVMVNGVARLGMPRIMGRLRAKGERITIGGEAREFHSDQASADPAVAQITLAEAMARLTATLGSLGSERLRAAAAPMAVFASDEPQWFLALDEVVPSGMEVRHRLSFAGEETGAPLAAMSTVAALPLVPLVLDPLTAVDDGEFLTTLASQANLPEGLTEELADLYR